MLGNVNHLSGNSIASPVQLRQEGIAMPENHMNFGEEWVPGKGGKGTGSWQRTKAPPPKAEPPAPMQPTAKGKGPAPSPKESPTLPRAKPKAAPGDSAANGAAKQEVKAEVKAEVKQEAKKEVKSEVKQEADDGLTEIERRRKALQMLQASKEEVKEEVKEEPEDEEPPAKRPCTGSERPAQGGGAMQQGLQGWATRVNALAGEDADLVGKCREFVRARILRAHAEGNLHDIDWEEEPVPSIEEVAGS